MRRVQLWCPECLAEVELEQFLGGGRCWHCGRWLEMMHECSLGADCADFIKVSDDAPTE